MTPFIIKIYIFFEKITIANNIKKIFYIIPKLPKSSLQKRKKLFIQQIWIYIKMNINILCYEKIEKYRKLIFIKN